MSPEPDEHVFFHGHPSWRSMVVFYIKGLLAAVVAGVLAGVITRISAHHVQAGWVSGAVAVYLVTVLVVGFVRRWQTTYTITNQRLTINTGLFKRDLHETRLERVQNVNCTQSLLERMLKVGKVDFDTAAGAEYDFSFNGVAHPRQIVQTVDEALRELTAGPNV